MFGACTGDTLPEQALLAPLDTLGGYTVGTKKVEVPGPNGLTLTTQIWFPANEDQPNADWYRYEGLVKGGARVDQMPDCTNTRPVFVFSHGDEGVRFQSAFLMEHLASHGFVVAAPDHTFNTYYDGDREQMLSVTMRRPGDLSAVYDYLVEQSGGSNGLLPGCVDSQAGFAVGGHSFGGYTVIAAAGALLSVEQSAAHCSNQEGWLCQILADYAAAHPSESLVDLSDERIWATIPIAPAGYEITLGGLHNISIPTMVLGGGLDTSTTVAAQVQPVFDGLSVEPRYLGIITRAGHVSFSNACDYMPVFDECEDEAFTPPHEVQAMTTVLVTAFLFETLGFAEASAYLGVEDQRLAWTAVVTE